EFSFRVVTEPGALAQALSRVFELHAERARASNMADHADYLSSPSARGLLFELARSPEQSPRLRVFELVIGDQVVAARLGFLLGDELYLYFSGYKPEWGRYSVMTTVVAEAIKWAIAQQL